MKRTINKKQVRHRRVRSKISGTKETPRLSVFRSNVHVFAQLIDDNSGKTLISASDIVKGAKGGKKTKAAVTKTESAKAVGMEIAKMAEGKGIKKVVFDRGGYKYHGRVKALAEGAREGGLKF